MPKVASGMREVGNLRKVHSENVAYELRRDIVPTTKGTLRLSGFVNHANMTIYCDCDAAAVCGEPCDVHYDIPGLYASQGTTSTEPKFPRPDTNDLPQLGSSPQAGYRRPFSKLCRTAEALSEEATL